MGTAAFENGPVLSKAAAASSWLQCNPCGELLTVKLLPFEVLLFACVFRFLFEQLLDRP